jgi:hypothetical protein
VVCAHRHDQRLDGGEDLVATEGRTDDIAALLAAVRLPDEPRSGICTMELPIISWFALLDSEGRWVRPGVPADSCGKIRIEVRDALKALHLTEVSKRALREIQSAEAHAAGCSQHWADIISAETGQGRRDWVPLAGDPFLGGGYDVRLCVYRVPGSGRGGGKHSGDFDSGGLLPAGRWRAIAKKLAEAEPAEDCDRRAGRFAVLRRADESYGEIYVELDGCRRVLVTPVGISASLVQGDEALVRLLVDGETGAVR